MFKLYEEEIDIIQLEQQLQSALDNHDIDQINILMLQIYPDYLKAYATTLIAYNTECGISGADIIRLKCLHPKAKFLALVCFEPKQILRYCRG